MKQKIYKLFSIVLTVALVFSCCTVAFTASAEITEAGPVFYVNPKNGDDTNNAGLTPDTATKTIAGAIAKAMTYDGDADSVPDYGAGDTVYVKLDGTDTTAVHTWGVNATTAELPKHAFKLNISSYGNKATIDMSGVVVLSNDTYFENVHLASNGAWGGFDFASHNVSFAANVTYKIGTYAQFLTSWKGEPPEQLNYYFESFPNADLHLGGYYNSRIFKNVNITLNNKDVIGRFALGERSASGAVTVYSKNLNFDIKNAAYFRLSNSEKNNPIAFDEGFAAQIINSTGNAALTDGAKTYLDTKKYSIIDTAAGTITETTTPVKYYILDNNTGLANALELTETAGKFKVNFDTQRFQLLANGAPVEIAGGFATFTPGKYKLTFKVLAPSNESYFVKTGATEGNGTEDAPFATIAEAIAAANANGCVYGDNVAIKLVGQEVVVWGETEEFSFVPVVESANKEALTPFMIGSDLLGEIKLDYVVVDNSTGEGQNRMFVNGKNIKLGANVQGNIVFVAAKQASKYSSGQTVEINTSAVKSIYVGHTNQNNLSFAGDVNYILNNAELSTTFNFMPTYGHKIGIDGNLNIKVVAAKSVTINKTTVEQDGNCVAGRVNITGEGKGATIIAPIDTELVGLDQFALISDNYFVIKTDKDIKFTEFAGEYIFEYDTEAYNLVVTDAEGNAAEYSYDDGLLVFDAPGEYTVKTECKCIYDSECDNKCNRCGEVDETRKHKFSGYTLNSAAECGKNATEIAYCDYGCGTTDVRDIEGTKLDHVYENYVSNNDATCTANGTETGKCACGAENTREVANSKKAHTSDKGTVTKKATCTATGTKTYKCTVCKTTLKSETIAKIAHSYKTTTTKATTKKNGSVVKACSVCGKVSSTTKIYYAKKVKLSTKEYTYSSSKTRKPSVKVYDYKGNKISSSNYTVTYASGRKKVGKYKVTIKLKGKYSGTLTAYFTIVPKESKVEKLTAAKKSLKVKLKKVSSQAKGYEIQYSTSKTFKSKYTKTKKVTSYKTTSVTLKSLKAKKTYYVRVRTYKTVNGKKYYSDWSSKKYKKTK